MNTRRAGPATLPRQPAAEPGFGPLDRRGFMIAAGAASASALAAGLGPAQAGPSPTARIHMVVADRRFAPSRAFAAEAARSGQRVEWISGDVTRLWYDHLDLLWRDRKAVIAGLTDYTAFFCLERLAMDRGLRVAFKGEHRALGSGGATHLIAGPRAVVTSRALAGLSDRGWAAQTARLAMAAPGAGPVEARFRRSTQAGLGQAPLLISWALAPRPETRI